MLRVTYSCRWRSLSELLIPVGWSPVKTIPIICVVVVGDGEGAGVKEIELSGW